MDINTIIAAISAGRALIEQATKLAELGFREDKLMQKDMDKVFAEAAEADARWDELVAKAKEKRNAD